MPYCYNCGTRLVDGAKFCTECGAPVTAAGVSDTSTPAPTQPNGYFPPVPQSAQPPRKNTALLVCVAAIAVLVIAVVALVLVLSLSGRGTDTPLAEKQTDAAVEITPTPDLPDATEETESPETEEESSSLPTVTAQGIEVAEISTLLQTYKAVTDAVIEATTDDFAAECSCGNLYDYDGDGYPELVLLYSLDGIALEAAIFRRTDDSAEPVCMQQELWHILAGGAGGAIYTGMLDTGDPVVFLESTSWEGETKIGKDYVYSLSDTDIEYLYRLEWYADVEGDLVNCWVFDANDELMSRDNVEQFLNIYNAREYYEASYPSDKYGVPLADLFSDEAMESYFSQDQ